MTGAKGEQVSIRGIPPDLWRKMRIESLERGVTMAELIRQMWGAYLWDRAGVEEIKS